MSERWKKGETLHQIARLFDRPHTSIWQILAESGGIRPPERRRSKLALTLAEREEISRALVAGESIRVVAARLARPPSTISREIARNGGASRYRAAQADEAAWQRAHRPKQCKLAQSAKLARLVTHKLQSQWSPEQIAGWLKHTYPGDESLQVSHEAIYPSLFIQARGALKKELLEHLRRTRGMRRSRHHTQKTDVHGKISDAISGECAGAPARKLPQELYKSLTWDRGKELAAHKRFTLATDIQVYFCDPQSPWQRGTNENTNGLLRKYLPKGLDISGYSQTSLDAIARKLNERPRKTLGYRTPAEMFDECVASTG
jgi:IS30 family transposase